MRGNLNPTALTVLTALVVALMGVLLVQANAKVPRPSTNGRGRSAVVAIVGRREMARVIAGSPQARAYFEGMSTADIEANGGGGGGGGGRRHDAAMMPTPAHRYLSDVVDDPGSEATDVVRRMVEEAGQLAAPLGLSHTWRVAVLARGGFGAQYPHTLGDVVCLPEDAIGRPGTVKTLVHERVHVFQRKRLEATRRLLQETWGLLRAMPAADLAASFPIRSNPDLDGWLWYDGPGDWMSPVVAQVYNSWHPKDLGDSTCRRLLLLSADSSYDADADHHLPLPPPPPPPAYEHPYERMAYELADLLTGSRHDDDPALLDWLASLPACG